nr:unnamed protein product [Callosobruchus analis]
MVEKLQDNVRAGLKDIPKEVYEDALWNWNNRLSKCIDAKDALSPDHNVSDGVEQALLSSGCVLDSPPFRKRFLGTTKPFETEPNEPGGDEIEKGFGRFVGSWTALDQGQLNLQKDKEFVTRKSEHIIKVRPPPLYEDDRKMMSNSFCFAWSLEICRRG